ncbi:hypothetical protein N7468_003095 [Penicillium chermesinum]|uniref:Uncharacterized protein n=1 Tax=Penicillium chermesinum TaxID=63820 RepID=A0A9W9TRA5_9EURO|nr:uncharacterized protein N7468_003095 [Penicillium chermesinum]KAJ5238476.1 hypothetical protein N7468_003095 [Penicillium chermesinum]KAJ6164134.1 hypothetical protein N7470_002806 [Penicillium chermesinum]
MVVKEDLEGLDFSSGVDVRRDRERRNDPISIHHHSEGHIGLASQTHSAIVGPNGAYFRVQGGIASRPITEATQEAHWLKHQPVGSWYICPSQPRDSKHVAQLLGHLTVKEDGVLGGPLTKVIRPEMIVREADDLLSFDELVFVGVHGHMTLCDKAKSAFEPEMRQSQSRHIVRKAEDVAKATWHRLFTIAARFLRMDHVKGLRPVPQSCVMQLLSVFGSQVFG